MKGPDTLAVWWWRKQVGWLFVFVCGFVSVESMGWFEFARMEGK